MRDAIRSDISMELMSKKGFEVTKQRVKSDTQSDTGTTSATLTIRELQSATQEPNRVRLLFDTTLEIFDRLQKDLREFAKNASGETSHTLVKMREFDTIRLRELVGNYCCRSQILVKVLELEESEAQMDKCIPAFVESDEALKTLVECIRAANRRLELTDTNDVNRIGLGFRRMMDGNDDSPSEIDVQTSLKACAAAAEVTEKLIGELRNGLCYQSGVEFSNPTKPLPQASIGAKA